MVRSGIFIGGGEECHKQGTQEPARDKQPGHLLSVTDKDSVFREVREYWRR